MTLNWNEKTRSKDIKGHSDRVLHLAWSIFDDKRIATASLDSTARIWNITPVGKDSYLELRGHSESVSNIRWDPSSADRIATASNDKSVALWDTRNGKMLHKISTSGQNLNMAFSPDGNYILVGNKDETITLIDTRQQAILMEKKVGNLQLNELTWNKAGNLIFVVTGLSGGEVLVLDPTTLEKVYSIPGHAVGICLGLDPKGRYLAVGSGDAVCNLWDLEEMICVRGLHEMDWPIRSVAFNWDGEYVALCSEDSYIGVFRSDTGALAHKIPTLAVSRTVSWHRSRNILAYSSDEINPRNRMLENNFRIYGFSQ